MHIFDVFLFFFFFFISHFLNVNSAGRRDELQRSDGDTSLFFPLFLFWWNIQEYAAFRSELKWHKQRKNVGMEMLCLLKFNLSKSFASFLSQRDLFQWDYPFRERKKKKNGERTNEERSDLIFHFFAKGASLIILLTSFC